MHSGPQYILNPEPNPEPNTLNQRLRARCASPQLAAGPSTDLRERVSLCLLSRPNTDLHQEIEERRNNKSVVTITSNLAPTAVGALVPLATVHPVPPCCAIPHKRLGTELGSTLWVVWVQLRGSHADL